MRFMIQVRSNKDMEAGIFPPNATEMFEAMDRFNQELVRDGWMLAGDGLHPSSKGARIVFGEGKPRVVDGPFAEAKELIAGYWVVQANSKAEVIERFAARGSAGRGARDPAAVRPVGFPGEHDHAGDPRARGAVDRGSEADRTAGVIAERVARGDLEFVAGCPPGRSEEDAVVHAAVTFA